MNTYDEKEPSMLSEEVMVAVSKLKTNKLPGEAPVIAEMLIVLEDTGTLGLMIGRNQYIYQYIRND